VKLCPSIGTTWCDSQLRDSKHAVVSVGLLSATWIQAWQTTMQGSALYGRTHRTDANPHVKSSATAKQPRLRPSIPESQITCSFTYQVPGTMHRDGPERRVTIGQIQSLEPYRLLMSADIERTTSRTLRKLDPSRLSCQTEKLRRCDRQAPGAPVARCARAAQKPDRET
jgi:hypothetical protein